MIDVQKIREDFNIYKSQPNLIYLDSAATSLTPDVVVDEICDYYKEYRATVHRTAYANGVRADDKYSATRKKVADFINADENEVIFTKGTTAGLNSLSRSLLSVLNPGDEVILSELEHHSNLLPWREFRKDINIKYIELVDMKITLEKVKEVITSKTKIISINHVSNIMGATTNIREITDYCHSLNIIVVVDGAQAVAHEVVDVKALGCDFYVFSAHKMLGPTGLGILYGREKLLNELVFDYGGDMAAYVTMDSVTVKEMPVGLEAGTPAISEVIGFGPAIDYLNTIGMPEVERHVNQLKVYAVEQMKKINDVIIYNADDCGATVAFNLRDFPVHDALTIYGKEGICLRGGHMCNYLTINKLGVDAIMRISFSVYNNYADIDEFIRVTKLILEGDELSWMDF